MSKMSMAMCKKDTLRVACLDSFEEGHIWMHVREM